MLQIVLGFAGSEKPVVREKLNAGSLQILTLFVTLFMTGYVERQKDVTEVEIEIMIW